MAERSTVNIDRELKDRLKKAAIDAQMPLYDYLEQIIREFIEDGNGNLPEDSSTCGENENNSG